MADVVTKIFVVSMTTAIERRARFVARAAEAELPWSFADAWTSLHPDLLYDADQTRSTHGRTLQPGEIGCYSSHFELWQRLIADDADQYIILEDDVIVDWKFIHILSSIDLKEEGIDYLRLYYKQPVPFIVRRQPFAMRDRRVIELFGRAYGTQAYIVTKSGAIRLRDACRIVSRPVDDEMDRSWDHGVPNLALFQGAVLEEATASHIGAERFSRITRTGKAAIARKQDTRSAARAYRMALARKWLSGGRRAVVNALPGREGR